ncbi:hypothetical protein J3Q64DRAFT_1769245 [Phycomyces blakesleeanus]|uniref:PH domain-containing protein n=2 Tax=Phycomyces blakesleeanus TaxID=4837 RepID=A0A163DCQ8_PHYB8|nr:hypothetical protein PHYBLDRAFT_171212 [Phycomyces blakesleeanus NRRL 1555(-)]OAD70460.1 hypothetical protein PHYBLDRAFT_171212 [Phycomyces blakesleeanus NRRL 1555(-)]|eukprot:XP_018288500.1 hypothetical protein PHYBLDRAFT_171212 [Phycomyces blakesleeanus NRRL 1555(-)]
MSFIVPKSDWLAKLSSGSFGRSRWRSRYFVLLDSELRYYKDEHTDSASSTLSLRDVSRVVACSFPNHPYCFRLEPNLNAPIQDKDSSLPPWTIECNSAFDQGAWVDVIQYRLARLSVIRVPVSPAQSRPRQRPFDTFLRMIKTSSSSSSSASASPRHTRQIRATQLNHQPIKDIPLTLHIQPIRSKDTFEQEEENNAYLSSEIIPIPRPQPRYPPSLSRRRGVLLSPLTTTRPLPCLDTPSESVASSASSGLESPVLDTAQHKINLDANGIKYLEETGSLSPAIFTNKDCFQIQ